MAKPAKHVRSHRRKPRDLIENILMDSVEKIEAVSLERMLTVNETDYLQRVHKLLVNAESSDAEVDALGKLTANQGNKIDDAVTEILEGLERDQNN